MDAVTTLNDIWDCGPCEPGWDTLLKYLNKTALDDEPLPLSVIIDSNGLSHAIWCLQAVQGTDRDARLFAVWCAKQSQHLLTHAWSRQAINMAERFATGGASTLAMRVAHSLALSLNANPVCDVVDAARREAELAAAAAGMSSAVAAASRASHHAATAIASDVMRIEKDPWKYPAAYKAAAALQEQKFREMFCADYAAPTKEMPTWML